MVELYIYYQVGDGDAGQLLPVVRAMQARLAAEHGVGTGLKRRPESEDGLQTWMEIYTGAGAGFGATLLHLVHGARYTEVFTEMPSCA
jgi:hypothetical protein